MLGFRVFSFSVSEILGLALISLLDLGFVLGVMVYDYGFHYGFFGHLHDRSNFGGGYCMYYSRYCYPMVGIALRCLWKL